MCIFSRNETTNWGEKKNIINVLTHANGSFRWHFILTTRDHIACSSSCTELWDITDDLRGSLFQCINGWRRFTEFLPNKVIASISPWTQISGEGLSNELWGQSKKIIAERITCSNNRLVHTQTWDLMSFSDVMHFMASFDLEDAGKHLCRFSHSNLTAWSFQTGALACVLGLKRRISFLWSIRLHILCNVVWVF